MKRAALGLMLLVALQMGCSKAEDVPVTQVNSTGRSLVQLKVTARNTYRLTPPVTDSLLPGVSVGVYDDEYNMQTHYDLLKSGVTGADGTVTFDFTQAKTYYIEATYPGFHAQQQAVTFPSNALVSFADFNFY